MPIMERERNLMNAVIGADVPGLRVSAQLAEILACPDCRTMLTETSHGLCCSACRQEFPVAAEKSLPILFSRRSSLASADYGDWERVEKKGTRKAGYRRS